MATTTQDVLTQDVLSPGVLNQGATTRTTPPRSAAADLRRRKAGEFWFYFVVTYPFFLAVALVSRLLPMSWRPFPRDAGAPRRSVFGEAKAAAYTMLPFVFMA